MQKLVLFITLLFAMYPATKVVSNYFDINQISNLDNQIDGMEGQVIQYQHEIEQYQHPTHSYDELKPGVYNVSDVNLDDYGIHKNYVDVLAPNTSLSMNYASKVMDDVYNHVLSDVDTARKILNATFDLLINITKSGQLENNTTIDYYNGTITIIYNTSSN